MYGICFIYIYVYTYIIIFILCIMYIEVYTGKDFIILLITSHEWA